MITSVLSGGLGNQMFQFAASYAASRRLGCDLRLDVSNYNKNLRSYELNVFPSINKSFKVGNFLKFNNGNRLKKLLFKYFDNYFYEKYAFIYDPEIETISKNTILNGYFQTEKYFKSYRDDLLKIFSFPHEKIKKLAFLTEEINTYNSVAIHVRRGDYVSNKNANKFHGVLPIDYYTQASDYFVKFDNVKFFIFSDDIHYVNLKFDFLKNKKILDVNRFNESYLDIFLMSQCKNQIIANSSFSWWGAWLNCYQEKLVIAPKKWIQKPSLPFDDITPPEWVKI